MATKTLPPAEKAANKTKRPPPAIQTVSESADVMVYSSPNLTQPDAEYEIVLRNPDVGTDSCTCPSGVAGKRCRHISTAWRMFTTHLDAVRKHARTAPTCPCCGDKTDINNECACWCLPDPNLPSCTNQPECPWAIRNPKSAMSAKLEAELAELVAERDAVEADSFHLG